MHPTFHPTCNISDVGYICVWKKKKKIVLDDVGRSLNSNFSSNIFSLTQHKFHVGCIWVKSHPTFYPFPSVLHNFIIFERFFFYNDMFFLEIFWTHNPPHPSGTFLGTVSIFNISSWIIFVNYPLSFLLFIQKSPLYLVFPLFRHPNPPTRLKRWQLQDPPSWIVKWMNMLCWMKSVGWSNSNAKFDFIQHSNQNVGWDVGCIYPCLYLTFLFSKNLFYMYIL